MLAADKKNEADCGMDGAWTGHPDQNEIALRQFPAPNQLLALRHRMSRQPDLRPAPIGVGQLTLAGTRAAVRTVTRYRQGALSGNGASLLDGYMEDLATDRIYRLMIAQRIRHRRQVKIVDDEGRSVEHSVEFINGVFDTELGKLIDELPPAAGSGVAESFREARALSEGMIMADEYDPV